MAVSYVGTDSLQTFDVGRSENRSAQIVNVKLLFKLGYYVLKRYAMRTDVTVAIASTKTSLDLNSAREPSGSGSKS